MPDLSGMRVLIVEDEGLVAMLIADLLTDLGCEVVAIASRLDDALVKARVMPIDMAVLDVNLAGKLSYPVAEMLRSRNIPFLFATGYGGLAVPAELRGAPVLAKPFHQEQLECALWAAKAPERSEHRP